MNNALVKQIPVCRMDWRLKPFQIGNIKKYMKQNLIFVLFLKQLLISAAEVMLRFIFT